MGNPMAASAFLPDPKIGPVLVHILNIITKVERESR